MATTPLPAEPERVWRREILDNEGVTERCHHGWIAKGKFPPPDGNLNGPHWWYRSTYTKWKAAVSAGEYSQHRSRGVTASAA